MLHTFVVFGSRWSVDRLLILFIMMARNCITNDDILSFLKNAYFGTIDNVYQTAVRSAYLDFNRTIEFKKCETLLLEEDKVDLRKNSSALIERDLKILFKNKSTDKETFDRWHSEVCSSIIDVYKKKGVVFHFGQAQKWINMTNKYLCVLAPAQMSPFINLLHVPIDSNVMEKAYDLLGLELPGRPWSRMNQEEYTHYQNELRDRISEKNQMAPILWEFQYWNR